MKMSYVSRQDSIALSHSYSVDRLVIVYEKNCPLIQLYVI